MTTPDRDWILPFDELDYLEAAVERRIQHAGRYRRSLAYIMDVEALWFRIATTLETLEQMDKDYYRLTPARDDEISARYWKSERGVFLIRIGRLMDRYLALQKAAIFVGPEITGAPNVIDHYKPHRGELDQTDARAHLEELRAGRKPEHPREAAAELQKLMGRDLCRCDHERRSQRGFSTDELRGCTLCTGCRLFVPADPL